MLRPIFQQLKNRFQRNGIPFNVETLLGFLETSCNRQLQIREIGSLALGLLRSNQRLERSSTPEHGLLATGVKDLIRTQCHVKSNKKRTQSRLRRLDSRYDSFLRGLVSHSLFGLAPKLPPRNPRYPAVEVFTTNYDDVLETFFERKSVEFTDGYRETGEVSRSGDIIVRFEEDEFRNPSPAKIYKLYGSIKYARIGNSTVKIEPYVWSFGGTHMGDLLVYPGATKVIWNEPQLQLFYRLQQRLYRAFYCIVIGYSFNDRAVAEMFLDALDSNKSLRIFVVSPSAENIKLEVFRNNPAVIPVHKRFEQFDPKRDLK